MKTIAIISPKGGVGKSTIALGLAVAAIKAGKIAAVIDLDPQATVAKWKDRRAQDTPAVVSAQASRLLPTLKVAEQGGAEFVIIDTAGRQDDSALQAARHADLVLIPIRPKMADLETLPAAKDILGMAGNPAALVVFNWLKPNANKQAEEAREIVRQTFGLQCTPMHLSDRTIYADAIATGQTPHELDTDGKAAAELDALFRFCSELVNNGTCEHDKGNERAASAA